MSIKYRLKLRQGLTDKQQLEADSVAELLATALEAAKHSQRQLEAARDKLIKLRRELK